MKGMRGVKNVLEIGEWCITHDDDVTWGVYADHLGCNEADEAPIEPGDLCWAHNDVPNKAGIAVCFYCDAPVPAEIQALVWLQVKW